MLIKTKKTSVIFFLINFMVLLDCNFFYLIQQPSLLQAVNGMFNKVLISILVIILFSWVVIKRPKICRAYRFCFWYSIMTIVFLLVLTVASNIIYSKQSFFRTVGVSIEYYILLLTLPLLYLLEMGYTEKKLLFYLEKFVFIWYVVCIVQYLYYFATGTSFLVDYFSDGTIKIRGESIRVGLLAFGNVAIVYHWEKFLTNTKTRKWNAVNVALGLFCVFFIQQTRMCYIADVVALVVVLLLCGKKVNIWLRNMMMFFAAVVFIFASGLPMTLFNSFFVASETYSLVTSTTIRVSAGIYYWQKIIQNPFIGIGFASSSLYSELIYGPDGLFYFGDLGLFGVVANMGILGFLIYVLPLFRMCYISFQIFKKRKVAEHALLIALLFYFIITSVSLAYIDAVRILATPWIIALFEYKWKLLRSEQKLGLGGDINNERYNSGEKHFHA